MPRDGSFGSQLLLSEKNGGMGVSVPMKLRQPGEENCEFKKLLADLRFDKQVLQGWCRPTDGNIEPNPH